jgi:hypothetical protein
MHLLGLPKHTKHVEVSIVARKPTKSKSKAGGLGKWFGEEWTDVKTGKPCGRKKGESRSYPACRPKAVASKISKKEAAKKTGPKKVKWSTTASGRKRT